MNPGRPSVYDYIARSGRGVPFSTDRAHAVWHVGRIDECLATLGPLDRKSRQALLEHAERARNGLAAILEGVDETLAHYRRETQPE